MGWHSQVALNLEPVQVVTGIVLRGRLSTKLVLVSLDIARVKTGSHELRCCLMQAQAGEVRIRYSLAVDLECLLRIDMSCLGQV